VFTTGFNDLDKVVEAIKDRACQGNAFGTAI
jgi:hypothetical protein